MKHSLAQSSDLRLNRSDHPHSRPITIMRTTNAVPTQGREKLSMFTFVPLWTAEENMEIKLVRGADELLLETALLAVIEAFLEV
jgi:hypothetical protein